MPNKSLRRDSSATEAYKQEDMSEAKPTSYIKEEQTSSDELRVQPKSNIRRHRASVACTLCRDRRIRCVVPTGKKACVQCERSSTPCIIKDDDERRRPISRAYVYSLVERVALLEQMLEDQGLTVPPADYPPETRHHSRRGKKTSSTDNASSFSSTPQESSVSDDHTTSSPYCSVDQSQDDHPSPNTNKRSLELFCTDNGSGHGNKRMRQDSLLTPADVKVESPIHTSLGSVTQCNGTFEFDQDMAITPSHQIPFWPMTYDHTGGLTALYPTSQDTNVEYCLFSGWKNGDFNFCEYNSHTMTTDYGETLPGAHQYDASSPPIGATTNLDFMPLGTNS